MTKKARQNLNKNYLCVGENFRHNAPIGDCGDVRTLIDWLKHLYPRKDEEELRRFFDPAQGYTNKDIIEYIYRSVGKRLEAV